MKKFSNLSSEATTDASSRLSRYLASGPSWVLVVFAASSAFMTYLCMYAFRKPYTVAGFEGLASPIAGLDFKIVLILAQIIGYMIAKFIGVKVIAEMTAERRAKTLVLLVISAEIALVLFALSSAPVNIIFLFINGLSLGLIWGLVFAYLEGRQTTEILGAFLSVTFIVASGWVRTVGKWLLIDVGISEIWMPAVTGAIFFIPLVISVYLLSQVPPPSKADEAARQHRAPMSGAERWAFFTKFAPGILLLVGSFLLFTGLRDFRDNFSNEVWTALGYGNEPSIFAYAGVRIAFLVLFALGAMVLIKNNVKAFFVNHGFIILGCLTMMISTYAFTHQLLDGKNWMVVMGAGLYVAYIPYNCFLFDRMICAVGMTANVGFLLYIADSAGYIGSVSMMLYRVLAEPDLSWLNFFIQLVYVVSIAGVVLVSASLIYFYFIISRRRNSCDVTIAT